MKKTDSIFIAGHNGLVGSSLEKILKDEGFKNRPFASKTAESSATMSLRPSISEKISQKLSIHIKWLTMRPFMSRPKRRFAQDVTTIEKM